MIDKADIRIALPPGNDRSEAVEKCEDIFRQCMYPTIDRVFSEYENSCILANRLEVDLGKVTIGEISSRLESELRRMLASFSVSSGEDKAEFLRQTFKDILAGTLPPITMEPTIQRGIVPDLMDELHIAGSAAIGSGHKTSSTYMPEANADMPEANADVTHQLDRPATHHSNAELDIDRLTDDEELLSLTVESAIKDRRVFYRLMELMDAGHLPHFALRLAKHLHISGDELESVLSIACPESHSERPSPELSKEVLEKRHSLSRPDLHNAISSYIESILFDETPFLLPQEPTVENLKTVSTEFKKRKMAFLERVADVQDSPKSIGRLFVDDAGIMLLSPFFSSLFMNLGYLDGAGQFKSLNHRIRAVHLTRCLSCGFAGRHSESGLLLSKVICGLSPLFPIVGKYRILKREKEEAEAMLTAAIEYWSSLKGTSIEGLRTAFLLRNGTLEQDDAGWIVRVEGKTIDILMEDIPWGFSTFVPSWAKIGIFVEWQKENDMVGSIN